MSVPRGIRNNNPGNIDHNSANAWEGELPVDKSIESRFARFDLPENGIRALGKLLLTYQRKYGLKTIEGLISRWAPSNENDTAAYVRSVQSKTKTAPGQEVDLRQIGIMTGVVKAIIEHENGGNPYTSAIVAEGVRRALV
jgi:hypothetical protein